MLPIDSNYYLMMKNGKITGKVVTFVLRTARDDMNWCGKFLLHCFMHIAFDVNLPRVFFSHFSSSLTLFLIYLDLMPNYGLFYLQHFHTIERIFLSPINCTQLYTTK